MDPLIKDSPVIMLILVSKLALERELDSDLAIKDSFLNGCKEI